jgi:HlyD family secretion protein
MQIDTSVAESDVGRLKEKMKANFTLDAYPGQVFEGTIRQVRNNSTTIQNVVTYDAVIDVENPKLLFRPGMTANVTIVTAVVPEALRVPNAAIRFKPPKVGPAAGAKAPATGAAGAGDSKVNAAIAAAIGGADSSGVRTVWVLRNKQLTGVSFKPGVSDGTFTEVAGGELREGDVLVTDILNADSANNAFRPF